MRNSSAPTEALDEHPAKQPRHIAVATRHLLAQREKAIVARDKASKEVDELTAALEALGYEA